MAPQSKGDTTIRRMRHDATDSSLRRAGLHAPIQPRDPKSILFLLERPQDGPRRMAQSRSRNRSVQIRPIRSIAVSHLRLRDHAGVGHSSDTVRCRLDGRWFLRHLLHRYAGWPRHIPVVPRALLASHRAKLLRRQQLMLGTSIVRGEWKMPCPCVLHLITRLDQ
jgi:hypothetical protein